MAPKCWGGGGGRASAHYVLSVETVLHCSYSSYSSCCYRDFCYSFVPVAFVVDVNKDYRSLCNFRNTTLVRICEFVKTVDVPATYLIEVSGDCFVYNRDTFSNHSQDVNFWYLMMIIITSVL